MALSKYSTDNARRHGPVGLVCDKIDVMITYTHTHTKEDGGEENVWAAESRVCTADWGPVLYSSTGM